MIYFEFTGSYIKSYEGKIWFINPKVFTLCSSQLPLLLIKNHVEHRVYKEDSEKLLHSYEGFSESMETGWSHDVYRGDLKENKMHHHRKWSSSCVLYLQHIKSEFFSSLLSGLPNFKVMIEEPCYVLEGKQGDIMETMLERLVFSFLKILW